MEKTIARTNRREQTPPRDSLAINASSADTLHWVLKLANKLMAPFSTYLERQYKISLNEFRVLMLVGRFPNAASHELAYMTGVDPMSNSRAVATLQKHDRVEVVRDATNRRRKMLALTAEGQKLYDLMRPQTDNVADYLISRLEPHEVATLNATLVKLIDTLEAQDESGRSLFMERTKPI